MKPSSPPASWLANRRGGSGMTTETTITYVDSNHLGTWPYECSGANDMPKTSEQQQLKHIFEDEAGLKWVKMAYDAQYRFARCLFRIAKEGLSASKHFKGAERCCSEWEDIKKNIVKMFLAL